MARFIVDYKNFEYARSTLVTNLTALLATDRFHYLRFAELSGFNPQRTQVCFG